MKGGITMSEFLEVVGNVGFPIAVSVYLLIRVENKLGELTAAIGELREAIILLPHEKYWPATPTMPSFPSSGQPAKQEYL
jgi:hypothetical protein